MSAAFDLREARQLERDVVAAGIEVGGDVLAVRVGDVRADLAGLDVRDGHGDTGNGGALLVGDTPCERAEAFLCDREAGDGHRHRDQKRTYACVHRLSLLHQRSSVFSCGLWSRGIEVVRRTPKSDARRLQAEKASAFRSTTRFARAQRAHQIGWDQWSIRRDER